MKQIIIFGAGKSATCLIDYLTKICEEKNWKLFIGDSDADALNKKLIPSSAVIPVQVNVENTLQREKLIQTADLIISLLPPALHILIARSCILHSKTLLTASYIDEEIKKLTGEISKKNLLFLYEMGLDPGIDHMSSMQIIHRIQSAGGKIISFYSHTGGLVSPESDDNVWHYKISWNPANVVKAGSAGAVYKKNGKITEISYTKIFESGGEVAIAPEGTWAWYPNRDSLSYIPVYKLESASTFIRTTLRHPDYKKGWNNFVQAGLTDDVTIVDPSLKTMAEWSRPLLPYLNESNKTLYESLDLFSDEALPEGLTTSAKILQSVLEKKWKMQEHDKDMILMLHEFIYQLDNQNYALRSSLIVKGENALRTAMAKTVGLPLGIAAKLILENKISLTGLHIPIVREIYEPVLLELEQEGIKFEETVN